jgi:pimeloyl-ACP methyl ester carboxylesterase
MIRTGKGPPLILFHGILCSESVWRRVVPLVADHHDTIVPTSLGHRGGAPAGRGPVRFSDLADEAERLLDGLAIDRAHLAGNSLGGWLSLELARRSRALSVCAFSPAGFWTASDPGKHRAGVAFRASIRQARMGRPFIRLVAWSARFRRWALRLIAVHGERATIDELLAFTDDMLECTVLDDLLSTGEAVAGLDGAACPITLAWSDPDRLLPLATHGARARERLPSARFKVLEGIGHVPMVDAPEVVAATILETTRAGG